MHDTEPTGRTDGSNVPPGDGLGFCLYRSVARSGLDEGDMATILREAQDNNRALGLTGCLHHEDGLFFQWIEGPRIALFRLLDKLREDGRHVDMTVLDQGSLAQRLFPDWQMRYSDPAAGSLLGWLASRPENPAAGVAEFLRSLASRGDDAR